MTDDELRKLCGSLQQYGNAYYIDLVLKEAEERRREASVAQPSTQEPTGAKDAETKDPASEPAGG